MVQQLPKPLIDLYNVYIHGGMSRREFMEGIEKFAVGGLTVAAISGALMPNYALGEVVPKNDSRLKIETVTVPSPRATRILKVNSRVRLLQLRTPNCRAFLWCTRIAVSTPTSKTSGGVWLLRALTRLLPTG